MKVFLSDLPEEALNIILPGGTDIFIAGSAEKKVHPCIGCMRCLLLKPGSCAISDRFSETVEAITECEELVFISECYFGSLSPDVKAAADRLFPYFQGEMEMRNEAAAFSHCIPRPKKLSFWFYGSDDAQIKKAARNYARLLADGWGIEAMETHFVDMAEDLVDAYRGVTV